MLQLRLACLGFLGVLAISGIAAATAAARLNWKVHGKFLTETESRPTPTGGGKAEIIFTRKGLTVMLVECKKFADAGKIKAFGIDELEKLELKECQEKDPNNCAIPNITLSDPTDSFLTGPLFIHDIQEAYVMDVPTANATCSIVGDDAVEGDLEGEWKNTGQEIVYPEKPLEGSTLKSGEDSVVFSASDKYELEEGGTLEVGEETALPELVQKGGGTIPAKTPVTATGSNPKLVGKGTTVECSTVETGEGGTTKGEVTGVTEKSISITLLFMGCKEASTKASCQSGSTEGSILTALLLATITLKGSEGGVFVRNAADKESESKELAKFKCGEKAITVGGCVPAKVKLTEESKMQEDVSEKESEVTEPNGHKFKCSEEAFGSKSEQVSTEILSYNKEGKLLALELVL